MTHHNDIARPVPPGKLRRRRNLLAATALASGCLAGSVRASDFSWNGPSFGSWSTAGNWLVGGSAPANSPTSSDNIITPTSFTTAGLNVSATVASWSFNSGSGQTISVSSGAPTLSITGLLSKAGTGTLVFRNGTAGGSVLTFSVPTITISGGTVLLGTGTAASNITIGDVGISAGSLGIAGGPSTSTLLATITGTLSMTGSSIMNLAGQGTPGSGTGEVRIGALDSASTTAVIQANTNTSSPYTPMLVLNATTGTKTFAGILRDSGNTATNSVSIVKNNGSTQIFSGTTNTYKGGTTINGGSLLVTNATGSGTGVGGVFVNNGGTLGGTGRIAPTGANGLSIASGGTLSPGVASASSLTVDLGSTTGGVTLASGAGLAFDLGAAAGSSTTTPGTSDRLVITGASAGDVTFNNNVIDFGGTGAVGVYKLFDSSLTTGTAWSGLTFSGQTITGGLSYTNLDPSLTIVTLFRGDGSFGEFDDIYLSAATPEPGSAMLVGSMLSIGLLSRRRSSRRGRA